MLLVRRADCADMMNALGVDTLGISAIVTSSKNNERARKLEFEGSLAKNLVSGHVQPCVDESPCGVGGLLSSRLWLLWNKITVLQ